MYVPPVAGSTCSLQFGGRLDIVAAGSIFARIGFELVEMFDCGAPESRESSTLTPPIVRTSAVCIGFDPETMPVGALLDLKRSAFSSSSCCAIALICASCAAASAAFSAAYRCCIISIADLRW